MPYTVKVITLISLASPARLVNPVSLVLWDINVKPYQSFFV